jgi:FKBP-type peptidyl-prolyl cis-trans isomerase FkpA
MLKPLRLLPAVLVAGLLGACAQSGDSGSSKADLKTDAQKFGYAIGVDLGQSLQPVKDDVDVAALKAGLDDAFNGKTLRLDEAARDEVKDTVSARMQQRQAEERSAQASKALEEGTKFLAENGKREGVKTTASGLQYEVLAEGKGAKPTAADTVTVHYRGTLINGEEFDSSHSRGEPATFPLANVISGWTEGVQLMSPGAKYKFYIPSELAYGERGAGVRISPNSTLIFEVELLSVEKAGK